MSFSPSFSPQNRLKKFTIIILLFLFTLLGVTPSSSERQASANQIKAAILFNFAKFVEWPPGTFAPDQKVITFCILAQEPMAEAVEALQGKVVQGRKIMVKRCLRVEEMTKCQVFFASSSDKSQLAQIIGVLRKYPVLTVTDEVNNFARIGGIINLTLVDDKYRFVIALNNANESGLKISSQLLKLSLRVNN